MSPINMNRRIDYDLLCASLFLQLPLLVLYSFDCIFKMSLNHAWFHLSTHKSNTLPVRIGSKMPITISLTQIMHIKCHAISFSLFPCNQSCVSHIVHSTMCYTCMIGVSNPISEDFSCMVTVEGDIICSQIVRGSFMKKVVS